MTSDRDPSGTEDGAGVTLINVFGVPLDEAGRFLEHWRASARIMAGQAGFHSARMYRAVDDDAEFRFVNVAEWATVSALARAQSDPRWRAEIQRLLADPGVHVTSQPALYRPAVDLRPRAGSRTEARYRFYRHRASPEFRLVLRIGDPFPSSTSEHQWEPARERVGSDVSADVLRDVDERGYALFRLRVELADIPPATDDRQ